MKTNMQTKKNIQKESIMADILSLDLPLFLLVDLSSTLDTLNEYKIKNIQYNKEDLMSFLLLLQHQYTEHMQYFSKHGDNSILPYLIPEHTGLLTQYMLDHHLYPDCSAQQACSIKCLFSVKCLLMIKEYINKRSSKNTILSHKSTALGKKFKQKIADKSNHL